MKAIVTEKFLITEDYWNRDEFEIVNEFPQGYLVWPIGRENFPFPGYLPLAKPGRMPYHIKRSELKTVKIDEELADRILVEAVRGTYGTIDKITFEEIINQ